MPASVQIVQNTTVVLAAAADADANLDGQVEEVTGLVACEHCYKHHLPHHSSLSIGDPKCAGVSTVVEGAVASPILIQQRAASVVPAGSQQPGYRQDEINFWPRAAGNCCGLVCVLIIAGPICIAAQDAQEGIQVGGLLLVFAVLSLLVTVCILCVHFAEMRAALQAKRPQVIRAGAVIGGIALVGGLIGIMVHQPLPGYMGVVFLGIICLMVTACQVCVLQWSCIALMCVCAIAGVYSWFL